MSGSLGNLVERVTILLGGGEVGLGDLGLDATACRPPLADPGSVALARRLAGNQIGELETFLGSRLGSVPGPRVSA